MKLITLVVVALVGLSTAAVLREPFEEKKIRYDNYSVHKITLENEEQRKLVEKLLENHESFNLWRSNGKEVDVMINPNQYYYFQNFTRARGISTELRIPNVQNLIDAEKLDIARADSDKFGWTQYNTLDAIYTWLDDILDAYPSVTESFVIGKSYEGRDIRGIKISQKPKNPGIFIESNIHAREWITSATATWFINELLTSTNEEVRELAEQIDWYIVPVLNVDGFVYSHQRDRMWRKTRQPVQGSACIGADPNRNYDTYWMENNGASANPCEETYGGTKPYSEPEIKAMEDFVSGIENRLNIMLAFHSYSQLLLAPYGHTREEEERPENYDDLMAVGQAYADAVENLPYKTDYAVGAWADVLYIASGGTSDWAYSNHDIKISYTIEFRDKGRFGFVLPAIQILPNCEETLAGLIALVKKARDLGYLALKY